MLYEVEISSDLSDWRSGAGEVEFLSSTNNGDGTTTEIYRAVELVGAHASSFMRLRMTER